MFKLKYVWPIQSMAAAQETIAKTNLCFCEMNGVMSEIVAGFFKRQPSISTACRINKTHWKRIQYMYLS